MSGKGCVVWLVEGAGLAASYQLASHQTAELCWNRSTYQTEEKPFPQEMAKNQGLWEKCRHGKVEEALVASTGTSHLVVMKPC